MANDAICDAMAVAFTDFKLVLEPGGGALAAALSGALAVTGKTIAIVASGGNVDRGMFVTALESGRD